MYLVRKPGTGDVRKQDPRRQRVFVVASRQALIDSRFSSVICAPVYSRHDGLSTQVAVGVAEGLKQHSSIHCDELVSMPRTMLVHYVGALTRTRLQELDQALRVALALDE
jgi:mRNA interferase MazF